MIKINTEIETLISRMAKLGYVLTGEIKMVAWGFWEGNFEAPFLKHPVRAQFHEGQIVFLENKD